jgi:hypothetical protein
MCSNCRRSSVSVAARGVVLAVMGPAGVGRSGAVSGSVGTTSQGMDRWLVGDHDQRTGLGEPWGWEYHVQGALSAETNRWIPPR